MPMFDVYFKNPIESGNHYFDKARVRAGSFGEAELKSGRAARFCAGNGIDRICMLETEEPEGQLTDGILYFGE
jgi:hypothetical protein